MRKLTQLLLSILIVLMSSNVYVSAESKSIDLESHLSLEHPTMLSGEKNHLVLGFKSTGPKTIIKDLNLKLELASSVQVDEDFLLSKLPNFVTYERLGQDIIFRFDEFESGKYYEIPIIFQVENGIIPNNTQLDFSLSGSHSEGKIDKQTVSTRVLASSALKVNKDYMGLAEKALEGTLGIAAGLSGKWKTKAVIAKKPYGQMFIKEGSQIVLTEKYDHETLEYVKVDGEKEPSIQKEGLLIWKFDAPSYEEQKVAQDLFFKEFDVIYRVKDDLKIEDKLDDQGANLSLEFVNIQGEVLTDMDQGFTSLYPSAEDTPEVDGNWWVPGHFGPSDAFGNFSEDFEAMNTKVTIYEWAKLTYAHQIASLEYGQTERYEKYEISYFINDHLILDEIKTPGRFLYRPNRDYGDGTYLEEQPNLDVHFYDAQDRLLASFKDVEENQHILRKDILAGHGDDTHIKKVKYVIRDFVPGMIVDEPSVNPKTGYPDVPTYHFSIAPSWKEDAVDNIYALKNDMMIELERKIPNGYREIFDFRDGTSSDYHVGYGDDLDSFMIGWYDLSAPRWANVTEEEETYVPTVTNRIELLEHKDGIVYPGENVLRLKLNNESVSNGAVLKELESYILIPNTVVLNLKNVNNVSLLRSENGHDLYKVQWDNDILIPHESLTLDIKVNVSEDLQELNLSHFTHLKGNESFKVLKVDHPSLQDSVLVNNPKTLETILSDVDLLLTGNHYTVLSDYYIEVEKFVKVDSDLDYKKTTKMQASDHVHYKLNFTNKKGHVVDRFRLMDVLPHVGDLGISNFVERGSEFDLVLNKAVKVDERFEVKYSTEKNPSRELLNQAVDHKAYDSLDKGNDTVWLMEEEVQDWSKIYSFMLELKEGEEIAVNESFSLEFSTILAQEVDTTKELYAHNSFALTANGSPVIEPLQVSVTLGEKEEPETPDKPSEETPTDPSKEIKGDKKPVSKSDVLPSTGRMTYLSLSLALMGIGLILMKRK